MDSQPRSEFGNETDPDYARPQFIPRLRKIMDQNGFQLVRTDYARPQFIPRLRKIMDQNGFELARTENNIYTFYHPLYEQTIRYETNAVFPEALNEEHRSCETLVLCGYELTNTPPHFIESYSHIITDSRTVYEEYEKQLFLTKSVSTLMYDPEWSYWKTLDHTPPMIQRYVKI